MKIKEFLNKMNFNSDVVIEVCDTDISVDNRTRLYRYDMGRGDYRGFENRKLNSFTCANGKLIIYAD